MVDIDKVCSYHLFPLDFSFTCYPTYLIAHATLKWRNEGRKQVEDDMRKKMERQPDVTQS